MTTIVDKVGLQWERAYPFAVGCLCTILGLYLMPKFFAASHLHQWAPENFFVAIFTLGTVAAGFGITLYTFLLTTETGFIGRTKRSIHYTMMISYLLNATIMSGILAIASIAGMVIKEPEGLYPVFWFGYTGWTSAAVFRAFHIFSIFAKEHR